MPLDEYKISATNVKETPNGSTITLELHDSDGSYSQAGATIKSDILSIESLPYAKPSFNAYIPSNPLLTADLYLDVPATFMEAFKNIATDLNCSEVQLPVLQNNPNVDAIQAFLEQDHQDNMGDYQFITEVALAIINIRLDFRQKALKIVRTVYDQTAHNLDFVKKDGLWRYTINK